MNKTAPHLPPQACSISTHTRWSNIRWLLIVLGVSFFAGLVAALVVVDRWYPVGLNGGTIFAPTHGALAQLDPSVVREWRYRVVNLYDETKLTHGTFYSQQASLGQAVIVNSSGWAITPINVGSVVRPGVSAAIDWQGKRYAVEKVVPDTTHGILFVKISGSDWHANTAFASRSAITAGRGVWGLKSDDFLPLTLSEKQLIQTGGYSILTDPFYYSVREPGADGRILITDRGELVGFTNSASSLIPVWNVEYTLPNIITTNNPKLAGFDLLGMFVDGQRTPSSTKEIVGFYVTDVIGKTSLTMPIKRGDVVVKVQGETVSQERLVEQVITAPNEFNVTVWRDGTLKDMKIKK